MDNYVLSFCVYVCVCACVCKCVRITHVSSRWILPGTGDHELSCPSPCEHEKVMVFCHSLSGLTLCPPLRFPPMHFISLSASFGQIGVDRR